MLINKACIVNLFENIRLPIHYISTGNNVKSNFSSKFLFNFRFDFFSEFRIVVQ
jgi:hypothetical protein